MFESGTREEFSAKAGQKQEVNDRDAQSQRHRRGIPKESRDMGMEEQALEMCPRKEVPENDSEEMLKR